MLPLLYWMLECTACGSRFVVYDTYLKEVGVPETSPIRVFGGGYEGPELPERYKCPKGCSEPVLADIAYCGGTLKAIASTWSPDAEEMSLLIPHPKSIRVRSRVRVKMTKDQSDEWRKLIKMAAQS